MTETNRKTGWKAPGRWAARRWRAPRWRAWVEALLGRLLRRAVRPGGPERLLARPPSRPMAVLRERWLVAARTLFPQIHLAIQPVLRQIHQGRVLPPAGLTPPAPLSHRPPVPWERGELAGEGRLRPSPGGRGGDGRGGGGEAGRGKPAPAAVAPLALVFQRLRAAEGAPGGTPRAWGERPVRTLHRAARSRTEQAPAALPPRVLARREAPGVPAASAAFAQPQAAYGPRDAQVRWNGAPSGFPAAAPSPLQSLQPANVEAITDHVMRKIDDRLHAWRERTGF